MTTAQVCVLLALGLVSCSAQIGPPGLCCMPRQFEGYLSYSGLAVGTGAPTFNVEYYNFYYDATFARLAVVGNLQGGVTKIINEYFEPARSYVIYDDGSCAIQALSHEYRDFCESADFVRTASFYYGVNTLTTIDAFNTQEVGVGFGHYYTFTNDCNMLYYQDYHSDASDTEYDNYGMLNMTEGIQDNSVFTPPGNCVVAQAAYESYQFNSLMKMFMMY